MATSIKAGPTPIPNKNKEQILSLDDLALCDITLSDFSAVQAWRDKLFDPEWIPEICDELPRLLTESMRESDTQTVSPYERRARALAHVFENKTPIVRENDLLPGQTTTAFVGAVVHADTIGYCIWPELKTVSTRRQNPFKIKEETAKRLNRDIFPYWLGRRTIQERARYSDYDTTSYKDSETDRVVSEPPGIDPPLSKKAGETPVCQALFERVAFFLSDKATCVSHTVPDFERLLTHGLDALIAQAEKDTANAGPRHKEMLEGVVRVFNGAKVYAEKLAVAAERCGNAELARICRKVPAKPADTFHEALSSIWICYHLLLQENTNFGFSIGRLDQVLNPYYIKGWRDSKTDKKQDFVRRAVELICHFFLRCSDHVPLSTEGAERLFAGSGSNQAVTLGGTRYENGKVVDAVNDMTYIILKATEILSIRDPNVHVRYHADIHGKNSAETDASNGHVDPYLRRICQVNILTRATPAIHGDVPAVAAMSKYYAAHAGISEAEALEDAYDYASIGCIEQNANGKHYGNTGSTLFVLPAIIELTLFGGKHRSTGTGPTDPDLFTGKTDGYSTTPLVRMKTMEEFLAAFRIQLDNMAKHAVQNNNYFGRVLAEHRPSPFLSGLFVGPTNTPETTDASFKDLAFGGAKYNSSGVAVIGLADVVDSLCIIEELVFGGKLSAENLLAAMDGNFSVDDDDMRKKVGMLRAIVNFFLRLFGRLKDENGKMPSGKMAEILAAIRRAPKYGAGIEERPPYDNASAVKYSRQIPEMVGEVFYKYRNHRGGRYLAGYWSMTNHAGFGMLTRAMPHGRRDYASFAGGITPCPGIEKRNGDSVNLLDHMLSVAKIDGTAIQNGYTYNLSLTTSGADRFDQDTERFGNYMRTFITEGGLLVQMCVESIDRFKAADAAATAVETNGGGENARAALAPYRDLMIRVAGYSAYFVTLSPLMRKEIIDRANFLIADGVEQHAVRRN